MSSLLASWYVLNLAPNGEMCTSDAPPARTVHAWKSGIISTSSSYLAITGLSSGCLHLVHTQPFLRHSISWSAEVGEAMHRYCHHVNQPQWLARDSRACGQTLRDQDTAKTTATTSISTDFGFLPRRPFRTHLVQVQSIQVLRSESICASEAMTVMCSL